MRLAGWGRFPMVEARQRRPRSQREVRGYAREESSWIPRGNGRAYGDAAINPRLTLSALAFDRILAFDPESGRITAEAGLLLSDLIDVFLPRGWFPPVTPGTRFVTVGGMAAADVHGKNHHCHGSFGEHVEALTLVGTDGQPWFCSADRNPELFRATLGGMGLTGFIIDVTFPLMPVETAWIRQEVLVAPDLDRALELFEESGDWMYSVGWIDCLAKGRNLGRSLVYRGVHALPEEMHGKAGDPLGQVPRKPRKLPIALPDWLLNSVSLRAFNGLYYRRGQANTGSGLSDLGTFFFPLDRITNWNRVYGRKGLLQYQCVLPKETSREGLVRLLERVSASGNGSVLAVLKRFGRGGFGPLSFPMEGYTLALDFPARIGVFNLLRELDGIVADHGGRLYLAKDARSGADLVSRGYPELDRFRSLRQKIGAKNRVQSLLGERLDL